MKQALIFVEPKPFLFVGFKEIELILTSVSVIAIIIELVSHRELD